MYGICNLSIIPIRNEASNTSIMISQLLFGEFFEIIESDKNWSYIKNFFDDTVGFIDNQQFEPISEDTFKKLSEEKKYYSKNLIDFVSDTNNNIFTIPIGSYLPSYKSEQLQLNHANFTYEGEVISGKSSKSKIVEIAFTFLNTPFLLGGKTPFGMDSSGFTQIVYKLCGYSLLREVTEQATQGEVLSFIEECEPGDLAFFDDENGNVNHVGIIMQDYKIIHAYGKVRIDQLDHSGIYNKELKKHTHKLRVIKKLIS